MVFLTFVFTSYSTEAFDIKVWADEEADKKNTPASVMSILFILSFMLDAVLICLAIRSRHVRRPVRHFFSVFVLFYSEIG